MLFAAVDCPTLRRERPQLRAGQFGPSFITVRGVYRAVVRLRMVYDVDAVPSLTVRCIRRWLRLTVIYRCTG